MDGKGGNMIRMKKKNDEEEVKKNEEEEKQDKEDKKTVEKPATHKQKHKYVKWEYVPSY
jgi:hypothetical protein